MSSCKRWIAALIAAVIMVSLAVPAWAVDTYTLTITSETKGHNYKAYQVFSGTIAKAPGTNTDTLVDIEWGNGVNGSALLNALKTAKFTNPEYTEGGEEPVTITPFASVTSAQDVADVLTGWGDNAVQLDEFAEVVGAHLNESNVKTPLPEDKEVQSTPEGKTIYTTTIKELSAGYYLLCEDAMDEPAEGENNHRAYTKFILELVGNTTVEAKADAPSIEKKIVPPKVAPNNNDQGKDTTVASVGDSVYFDLTGTVPSMDGYDKYFYIIVDTLSKGLTFDSGYEYFLSIYRENGELADTVAKGDLQHNPFYTVTSTVNGNGTTTLKIVINNAIRLKEFAGGKVCFTYRATLNQNAVIGNSGNPNSVHLEYSNNPNYDYRGENEPTGNDPMGQTPEDYVIVYTGAVQVRKVDSDGKALTGAGFTLTGQGANQVKVTTNKFVEDNENGTYYKLKDGTYTTTEPTPETTNQYDDPDQKYALEQTVAWTGTNTSSTTIAGDVGQDGYLTFGGLGEGTYTIEETTVPTGYNKIDNITVTLSFAPPQTVVTGQEKGTWSATYRVGNGNSDGASVDTDGTIHFQVENRSGAVLPSTGGMGTTLFVAGGLVLMVVAATLLVVRARAARKDQEENQN